MHYRMKLKCELHTAPALFKLDHCYRSTIQTNEYIQTHTHIHVPECRWRRGCGLLCSRACWPWASAAPPAGAPVGWENNSVKCVNISMWWVWGMLNCLLWENKKKRNSSYSMMSNTRRHINSNYNYTQNNTNTHVTVSTKTHLPLAVWVVLRVLV